MDSGILARIVNDIQEAEGKFSFQSTVQSILEAVRSATQANIDSNRKKLEDDTNQTVFPGYVKTDYEALGLLGVQEYFGLGLIEKIDSILNQSQIAAQSSMESFVESRQVMYSRVEALRSSLSALNISPRVIDESQFEIGFSFPTAYSDIDKLTNALDDVNKFLNELSAAKGQEPIKIAYVSNGSFVFFIHSGQVLAHDVEIVSRHILDICGTISVLSETKKQFDKFASKRKKTIVSEIDAEKQEKVDKAIIALMKELNIKSSEDHDRVKKTFAILVDHLAQGVFAEVRAPAISAPPEPDETSSASEKKTYQSKKSDYDLSQQIEETNKQLYLLAREDLSEAAKLLAQKLESEIDNEEAKP